MLSVIKPDTKSELFNEEPNGRQNATTATGKSKYAHTVVKKLSAPWKKVLTLVSSQSLCRELGMIPMTQQFFCLLIEIIFLRSNTFKHEERKSFMQGLANLATSCRQNAGEEFNYINLPPKCADHDYIIVILWISYPARRGLSPCYGDRKLSGQHTVFSKSAEPHADCRQGNSRGLGSIVVKLTIRVSLDLSQFRSHDKFWKHIKNPAGWLELTKEKYKWTCGNFSTSRIGITFCAIP